MFLQYAALCLHFEAVIVKITKNSFCVNVALKNAKYFFFFTIEGAIIKGAFKFSGGGHYDNL